MNSVKIRTKQTLTRKALLEKANGKADKVDAPSLAAEY